ncbi:MAG: transcription termination/antitermination protein NusA, partial [Nitrospirae bacterium]
KKGDISIICKKKIVKDVKKRAEEITLEEAEKIEKGKSYGDTIDVSIPLEDLGRIAVQAAKQVLFQKVREAETEVIYDEFKNKIGQIISGVVMRKERGCYYINIGKTEAILYQKDTSPLDSFKRGETIKAYIDDVKKTPKGPVIRLNRTKPEFVAGLFALEVPEIYDGLVVIKKIVREPGERTKLIVYSGDKSIDPVGSCVGMKGTRVQAIVRELRGERIDIIPYTDDPRLLIAKALSPAVVEKIGINEEEKTAVVIVDDSQLSLAIGKRGQNVRLAMKLTGWNIDIMSTTEYDKIKMEETEKQLKESFAEAEEDKKT